MAKKGSKPKRRAKQPKPPPRCKAFLLCDRTIVEAITRKVSLIGTFAAFSVPKFPHRTSPFTVFLQMTDGIGRYDIVVEFVDLMDDKIIGRSPEIGIEWVDRLSAFTLIIPVPSAPLEHAGTYDIIVYANGQEVERQRFTAASVQSE